MSDLFSNQLATTGDPAVCSKDLLAVPSNNKIGGFTHDRDLENGKEEWLTPPEIIKALGVFDLDPCAPINRPWSTAKNHFTIQEDEENCTEETRREFVALRRESV